MKDVPLVIYENGERKVIGTAVVHDDGRVEGEITEEGIVLSEVLKSSMVFGASLGPFRADGPLTKGPVFSCPTEGCEGDTRYAAPGRGHIQECTYPNGA